MKRPLGEEITAHLERAQHALEAAQALCNAGLFDDAASRAYYAAFHAASAALMAQGQTFKKHSALIGAVHKYLVKTGLLDVEAGKALTWLFELRAVGDYGEIIHVDESQARLALTRAQVLYSTFRKSLQK